MAAEQEKPKSDEVEDKELENVDGGSIPLLQQPSDQKMNKPGAGDRKGQVEL